MAKLKDAVVLSVEEDGYVVVELPVVTARARVMIVRKSSDEGAPVYKDCWQAALVDIRAGHAVREEHRAPCYQGDLLWFRSALKPELDEQENG